MIVRSLGKVLLHQLHTIGQPAFCQLVHFLDFVECFSDRFRHLVVEKNDLPFRIGSFTIDTTKQFARAPIL